jgi:hypothetical protein
MAAVEEEDAGAMAGEMRIERHLKDLSPEAEALSVSRGYGGEVKGRHQIDIWFFNSKGIWALRLSHLRLGFFLASLLFRSDQRLIDVAVASPRELRIQASVT